MKFIFYVIILLFAYRMLRKFLLPAPVRQSRTARETVKEQFFQQMRPPEDKSGVIEDIDYEEVD